MPTGAPPVTANADD